MTSITDQNVIIARALALALHDLDSGRSDQPGRSKDSEEAHRIAALLRERVPDVDQLAKLCAEMEAKILPDWVADSAMDSYNGPDVFRSDYEWGGAYPDEEGVDYNAEDFKTWPNRNGLGAESKLFAERVRLYRLPHRERLKEERKMAAYRKREARKAALRQPA